MSVEDNVRVVRDAIEALNRRDWARFRSLHTESIVVHFPGSQEPLKGYSAVQAMLEGFIKAFPDIRGIPIREFGQGDWVCVEGMNEGTHTGPLESPDEKTIPATNRTVRFPEVDIFRVEGGRITEARLYFDNLGFLAQLGLGPVGSP